MIKSLLVASLALVFTSQAAGGNGNGLPKPHPTTMTTTAPMLTATVSPPGDCPTWEPDEQDRLC